MTEVSVEIIPEGYSVTARRYRYMADRLSPAEMLETNAMIVKAMEEYHAATWGRGIQDNPGTKVRWPQQHGPLWLTGDLRESMTKSDAPGAVRAVTPHGIVFGTDIFYGVFLNDGTVNMPPKPFIRFNTPMKVLIRDIFFKRARAIVGHTEGFPSPGLAGRDEDE